MHTNLTNLSSWKKIRFGHNILCMHPIHNYCYSYQNYFHYWPITMLQHERRTALNSRYKLMNLHACALCKIYKHSQAIFAVAMPGKIHNIYQS